MLRREKRTDLYKEKEKSDDNLQLQDLMMLKMSGEVDVFDHLG